MLDLMAGDPVHPLSSTEERFPIALSCQTPATAGALHKANVRPLHRGKQPQHNPRSSSAVPSPQTALSTVISIYISGHADSTTSPSRHIHGTRAPRAPQSPAQTGPHGRRSTRCTAIELRATNAPRFTAAPTAQGPGKGRPEAQHPQPGAPLLQPAALPRPMAPLRRARLPCAERAAPHSPGPARAGGGRGSRGEARAGGWRRMQRGPDSPAPLLRRLPRKGSGGVRGRRFPSDPEGMAGGGVSAAAGGGLCPDPNPGSSGPGQTVTVSPEPEPGRSPQDGAATSSLTQFSRRPDLPKMAVACPPGVLSKMAAGEGGCSHSRGSRPGRALETNRVKKQLQGNGCNSSKHPASPRLRRCSWLCPAQLEPGWGAGLSPSLHCQG